MYPLGFTGAEKVALAPDGPVRHRLGQLEAWLDYAVDLGCSGLLLGPVFAAETHGYDTVDHFEIDHRLGDQEDFEHLVAEAGRRGLRPLAWRGVSGSLRRECEPATMWLVSWPAMIGRCACRF